jgi:hypothetical protein
MGEVVGMAPGTRSAWWRRMIGVLSGGTTFDGARDLYKAFGYKQTPVFEDFLFKYVRQDIAKRVIDAPVKATWGDPPIIEADDPFTLAWQDLTARIQVWHEMMRLDRLAGLGQYAVMIIGCNDGRPLSQPLIPATDGRVNPALRQITYLQSYSEKSTEVIEYDTNSQSPRFGLPSLYEIQPQDTDAGQLQTRTTSTSQRMRSVKRDPFQVHWSRVLHVADNTLENDVYGSSRLESVYNLLDDLIKVVGGSAETYWLTANRGLHIDVDKELDLKQDDAKDLTDEVTEYEHGLRRFIRTRGVKINNLGSDLADPWNNVDVIISLIASATGIPKRVLMGSEAGQLASTQDRANWAERISERQADFAQPVMLIPFIMRCIEMGVLPQPVSLQITWPEAFKMSPLERAQTAAQMARSAANLQKVLSEPIGSEAVEEVEDVPAVQGQDATPDTQQVDAVTGQTTTVPGTPAVAAVPGFKRTRTFIRGGQPIVTLEEARAIIGHGKRVPIFDESQDTSNTVQPNDGQ